MNFSTEVLRSDERAIYELRELYRKFGYSGYKVGRFEEYDLYAHNKSFLVSEDILTFTDTNGKLMALKPDITLSIVKNIVPNKKTVRKLYYNENVYRTSAESHGFKEIMQTGLECIGYVDEFAVSEVVMLALRSLQSISVDYMLDISHMGIIEGLFDSAELNETDRDILAGYVKSKNTASIINMSNDGKISKELCDIICNLTKIYCTLSNSLSIIEKYLVNQKIKDAYYQLKSISETMDMYGLSEKLFFDFSVMNDCNYYDGIIFKGFINGIPDSILSGGRYDKLVQKMGKNCGAIGFAVYLDRLERFDNESRSFDVDVLLVYDETDDKNSIIDTVKRLNKEGKTVKTSLCKDTSIIYRQLVKMSNGGIEILETND